MRVLLVEDDELLRALTSRILKGMGHDVIEATDSAGALAQIGPPAEFVDVLFTDVKLGGDADGVDLARRALSVIPHLRVVLSSGDPSSFKATDLPRSRVQTLAKPYRKEQLRQALDALVGPGAVDLP